MEALFGKITQNIQELSKNFLGFFWGFCLNWPLWELRAIVSEGSTSEEISISEKIQKVLKKQKHTSLRFMIFGLLGRSITGLFFS